MVHFHFRSRYKIINEHFIQVIYCGLCRDTYRHGAQVNNLKQYGQERLCTKHKGSISV